jgi:DNA-binding NarL/FixJ family response regulator
MLLQPGLGRSRAPALVGASDHVDSGAVGTSCEPVRVLIVDDDYYAREATRALLSRDRRTRVWGVSASNQETDRLLRESAPAFHPDVILHDVHMTEGPRAGIEAIPGIKALAPSAKILIMSMDCAEDVIMDAIVAGADGYVWKNESADGLASAIVETAAGRFVVTRSIAERLLGSAVDLHGYATEILPEAHPYRDLTDSIRETLHLFCVCGMSAGEISSELQVSINTVYSRIKTAYQVLDAKSREDAFQRFVERTTPDAATRMV